MNEIITTKLKFAYRKIRSSMEYAFRDLANKDAVISEKPVFILGNQKSGTSAVAALLSELTNTSSCIDLKKEIWSPVYYKVLEGEIPFCQFIERNRVDFSKFIIKEPNLTFMHKNLFDYFPESKAVFVIRDPKNNIKSILKRLAIPGHLTSLEEGRKLTLPYSWRLILENRGLNTDFHKNTSYIEALAHRWNLASDVLLNFLHLESCSSSKSNDKQNKFFFIRYEDFIIDKIGELEKLAYSLNLEPSNDISSKVNVQFQPRGKRNASWKKEETDWIDFYGIENLTKIRTICENNMKRFGYNISD